MTPSPPMTLLQWKLLRWLATPPGNPPRQTLRSFNLDRQGQPLFYEDLTASAAAGAREFVSRGWVTVDTYGNHRLNAEGLAAAHALPKPTWSPTPPPVLLDRDIETLRDLQGASDDGERWATSYHCGGANGSYHSGSLTKLVRHGLAECYSTSRGALNCETIIAEPRLSKRAKGSRTFRITSRGLVELANRASDCATKATA